MIAAVLIMHTVPLIAPLAILIHTTPLMIASVILAATFLIDVISANVASYEQWEWNGRYETSTYNPHTKKSQEIERSYRILERSNSIIGCLFSRSKEANIKLNTETDCRTQKTTSNLTATVNGNLIILATLPSDVKSMLANDISKSEMTGYRKGYDLTPAEAASMIEFTANPAKAGSNPEKAGKKLVAYQPRGM